MVWSAAPLCLFTFLTCCFPSHPWPDLLPGTAAIQIAKQIGAQIFTTAGSQDKLDLARELGADRLINYKEENFVEVVQQQTQGPEIKVSFPLGNGGLPYGKGCLSQGNGGVFQGNWSPALGE